MEEKCKRNWDKRKKHGGIPTIGATFGNRDRK